jgi:flagellar hook assembly protein FlgD
MGVGVFGATSGTVNQYTYASGTSAAAPIAAGVAGLLLSAYPELTNVQLRDILLKTADNYFTPDNNKGYGLVSAADAITYPVILSYVNKFTLNKIYLDSLLDNNSVNVHFSKDGVTFNMGKMNLIGKRFEIDIPATITGDKIFFYFTAVNSNGNIIRTPSNENIFYTIEYGKTADPGQILIIPDDFVLEQNYPNPFNQGTKIVFYSPQEIQAELTVYNVLGEKVKTLFSGIAAKGLNQVNWDGRTSSGSQAATGIYLYAVKTGDKIFTKKMLLLR